MKSAFAILLLILLGLLSCMLPLRYGLRQAAKAVMHHRMQSGKETTPLLIAASDLADAEWEEDHEFRLHGQMYDVEGIEYHDGHKYFRCVTDALETRMEHTADDVVVHLSGHEQNKSQERQIAKALSEWFQGLYCNTTRSLPAVYFMPGTGNQYFTTSTDATEDRFSRRIIIPPEA